MIIGVLGNVIVLFYTIFMEREKTATSYLTGNLAMADLLVCLTLYPIWIVEFIQTILNIDGDQELFCDLSRSTIWALLFASMATLLAITIDRYLYIVKPLKYPIIVTKRRVLLAISGIWPTTLCVLILIVVQDLYKKDDKGKRSLCDISMVTLLLINSSIVYIPLTFILILNFRILNIARIQRKRVVAEANHFIAGRNFNSSEQSFKQLSSIQRFFKAIKAVKTFSIVVAVLTFCVLTPTVVGVALEYFRSDSSIFIWFVVIHYEFIGINSILNAFIYGMRHIRYKRAFRDILFRILRCNRSNK
ncbi:alpha-1A adrenergic receptor-like [Dendronephthya gigantea]|uniref:alpha-1A adrenergic receptor-like n=1 Tax=Dendronephthya gigantea TaxID=151771 RepID=UPI00106AD29E|nr:alpha-1A adrenergic receptor-like [Dendronephthya gigantea]